MKDRSSQQWQNASRLALISTLCLCAGCVTERVDGATHVFTYEMWVPTTVTVCGLLAVGVGWFTRSVRRLGWGLLIFGAIAGGLFGPSMFLDKAVIAEDHFSLRTGIWGLTKHEVPLNAVGSARLTEEIKRGRRGRRQVKRYLICEKSYDQPGKPWKLPMNNLVMKAASPLLLEQLGIREIPVTDETR